MVVGIKHAGTERCALGQPRNPQSDLLPLTCAVFNSHTSWIIVSGEKEAQQHTSVTSSGASDCSFIINECVHELKAIF